MTRTTLAIVMSSLLLGAAAAHSEQATQPTQGTGAQAAGPTDTPPRGSDASPSAGDNEPVGTPESNVDEKATSGSYYPFSAGTVGDTPAEPRSTSPTPDDGDMDAGPTDQWTRGDTDSDGYLSRNELAQLAPTLASSFADMDVDRDGKLTRAEFRTWRLSQKARMDADQPAAPRPTAGQPGTATPAGDTPAEDASNGNATDARPD